MRRATSLALPALAAVVVSALGLAVPAAAHTESDLVAVPAGGEATVTLRPTHGCGDAATVEVAIRAPVAGATAGAVAGWTESAEAADGQTVLTWTGGVLPTDVEGAFPVTFAVPDDAVGELLLFPSVQRCEDGQELAWIDGDPEAEYPAPRLLVLPAGSSPAATIDEVPPDAPGRDQLTAVVDVDNPAGTTVPAPTDATTSSPPSTQPETTTTAPADDIGSGDDGGDSSPLPWILLGVAVVGAGAFAVVRARRTD